MDFSNTISTTAVIDAFIKYFNDYLWDAAVKQLKKDTDLKLSDAEFESLKPRIMSTIYDATLFCVFPSINWCDSKYNKRDRKKEFDALIEKFNEDHPNYFLDAEIKYTDVIDELCKYILNKRLTMSYTFSTTNHEVAISERVEKCSEQLAYLIKKMAKDPEYLKPKKNPTMNVEHKPATTDADDADVDDYRFDYKVEVA